MATIKLKLGSLELESEGPEEFLKAEVPNFLKLALETYKEVPAHTTALQHSPNAHAHPINSHAHSINGNGGAIPGFQSTTENIAVKLDVKSAPDLIVAAAARLAFVQGKDTFTRDELLGEMKTATAYYSEGHRKNMTNSLRSLVKDDIFNEITTGNYALSAPAKTEIQAKIRG